MFSARWEPIGVVGKMENSRIRKVRARVGEINSAERTEIRPNKKRSQIITERRARNEYDNCYYRRRNDDRNRTNAENVNFVPTYCNLYVSS